MNRVFIAEEQRNAYNFAPAAKFGKIYFIWSAKDDRPGLFHFAEYIAATKKRLADLKFGAEDYLLIVGGTVQNILTVIAAMQMYDQINILFFDTRDREYKPARF